MDWKNYEGVVRYIYEQLGKATRVRVICSGSNCKITGKSGVEHQIDVLTEHSDGLHAYRTAIECKYWADKVQKDTVAKLAEILEDAKIEKGVIVSKRDLRPTRYLSRSTRTSALSSCVSRRMMIGKGV